MVGQIYPTELQLNKANYFDTEVSFLDLDLSITNGIVSSKINDKQDDFHFEIINFPSLHCLQFVIVVFADHTHLLLFMEMFLALPFL